MKSNANHIRYEVVDKVYCQSYFQNKCSVELRDKMVSTFSGTQTQILDNIHHEIKDCQKHSLASS